MTLVSAVRVSGVAGGLLFRGTLDGDAFEASLDRVLLPALAPGDVPVMDDLPAAFSASLAAVTPADCRGRFRACGIHA